MAEDRTKTEKEALELDLEVYKLMCRAARVGTFHKGRGERIATKNWMRVIDRLSRARAPIRALMHPTDRQETI